jgi:hypothetical protein
MAAASSWKDKLAGDMPPLWAEQIDEFEAQIRLRKAGKIDEKVFAETRLRRGAYGQRYDNGQRHDGIAQQTLPYPSLTKGPETFFDAPGMQRIKIPFGGMNPDQMIVMAELAEEYSDSICHITTRQDIQLHFIHIDDCPGHFPSPGGGRHHDARGVRQFRPQRHRLPARGRVQYRIVRRHAVREGVRVLSAWPSRHAGFRP